MQALLRAQPVPRGPEDAATIARKLFDRVLPSEREAAAPPGSKETTPVCQALAARLSLVFAEASAQKLLAAAQPVLVDSQVVAALIRQADEAGERLQRGATQCIAKGDTEGLRTLSAARASLSAEVHAFDQLVDRLRGVGSSPTLGPGDFDPELVKTARPPPPRARPAPGAEPGAHHAEFAEFQNRPAQAGARRRSTALVVVVLLFLIALGNLLFFSRLNPVQSAHSDVEQAGPGVLKIAVAKHSALVSVSRAWVEHAGENARPLSAVLMRLGADKAILLDEDGKTLGTLEAKSAHPVVVRPKAEQARPDERGAR